MRRIRSADGHLGWLATTHAEVRTVLGDPRFSARQELKHPLRQAVRPNDAREPAAPGWFPGMDAPEHTRYRRMVHAQFSPRRMRQLEPRIREITQERLNAMKGPTADLIREFALPIPSLVICELLGVPYGDHEFFEEQTALIARLDPRAQEALGALGKYLGELVASKRDQPGDDLVSGLIKEGELSDEELVNIALLLLVAGHETTANMIGLGVLTLLEEPACIEALRRDPGAAVEELLRRLSIVGTISRAALEDVEVEGTLVGAGDTVTLDLMAANHDAAVFDEPDRLVLDREEARLQLAFAHGPHLCLGHHLARLEMRIAYLALFDRFPGLRVAAPYEDLVFKQGAVRGLVELPVTGLRAG
ncbi:cytochrome P450 [Nonomuraea sediminis]|uniref:cytochrome P450 n=1 Tax=Nonomuraea sediminis TaxID=2835864 RepID=UPI001BDD5961|nr:cytochrome P450 [Nonomuraea sediminis]